jgi:hypothetical protein
VGVKLAVTPAELTEGISLPKWQEAALQSRLGTGADFPERSKRTRMVTRVVDPFATAASELRQGSPVAMALWMAAALVAVVAAYNTNTRQPGRRQTPRFDASGRDGSGTRRGRWFLNWVSRV